MKLKTRFLSAVLATALAVGLLTTGVSAAVFNRIRTYTPGQFTDVATNAWYASSIKDAYELGLMSGTGDTTFSPSGIFTVAESLALAARMHNIYHGGNGTLPNTSPDWRQNAINYCLSNGIIREGQFDSYVRSATRAEMAGIVAAALPDSEWNAINSVKELPDVSTSTESSAAIFKLYNAGVFTGSDVYGMFQPYASITRSEVAAIAARCADPALRKTLHLLPLSQRQAPEIIDASHKMSNGLMLFQDSGTKRYGYIDGSGTVRISAKYAEAKDFSYGYAPVLDNSTRKWGLIDTSGDGLKVPASYLSMTHIGYGVFTAQDSNGYAIVVNGALQTKSVYPEVKTNGVYIFARCKTSNSYAYDIYDMTGSKLGHFDGEISWKTGSPLLAVKSGNKWALAVGKRAVTDYLYDSIELYENATLALLKNGSMRGLAGENGIVKGCDLGDRTTYYDINGGYALTWDDATGMNLVVDATGWTSEPFENVLNWGSAKVEDNSDKGVVFAYGYGMVVIDKTTGKVYTPVEMHHNNDKPKYALMEDGTCYLGDGTRCTEFTLCGNNACATFCVDGKYGLVRKDEQFDTQIVVQPVCSSEEEAQNAYGYYKIDKENGKPVVTYGNEASGFSADQGIHYYKNNIYYDQIKAVGEDYYACLYNTTWYLVHA